LPVTAHDCLPAPQSKKSNKPDDADKKPDEQSRAVDAQARRGKAGDNASDALFAGLADNKMLE